MDAIFLRRQKKNSLIHSYSQNLGRISDRQHKEAALVAAQRDAESANTAKSMFLANMSHELRTPLNAILGFSELMISGLIGPEHAREKHLEYAKDIRTAGEHLLNLINDILDLAKVDAGKVELEEDWVDMNAIFSGCTALFREQAQRSAISLRTELREHPLLLWADERKLKQILINLVSNALKFTQAGGDLKILGKKDAYGGFVIFVIDTGIGMSPDHICKALEPFTQVDSDLNRRYEGTGLGLPLTKALVELHDGLLQIESRIGEGTTVMVRFPAERVFDGTAAAEPEAAPDGAEPSMPAENTEGLRPSAVDCAKLS